MAPVGSIESKRMKQDEIQHRRDKIIDKLHLKDDLGDGLEEATDILQKYLKERHMNVTPERQFILWTIYHLDAPFDVDALHQLVCQHRTQVCRATVYNNLILFTEAGVVSRFQPFPNGTQYFEKNIRQKPHGYQICRRCGSIKVIATDVASELIGTQLNKTFHLSQFCIYALGLCKTCYNTERREVKEKDKLKQREKDSQKKSASPKKK